MTSVEPRDFELGPATRLLWRGPGAVHLELGSRSVIVEGLPPELVARVVGADMPAPTPPLDHAAAEVLDELADDGYLWPRSVDEDDLRRTPPTPRLAGELTALAARHGEHASELLSARRHASVVVQGSGRVAPHLAAVLAAAGVGRVRCLASGRARLQDATPGGIAPGDEGSDLALTAEAAIRRAAPDVDTAALPVDERPDLTILAVDAPVDDDRRAALHATGAAHLRVSLGVDHGVVGPLVLPGLTSCLRCADLHRRDRDPAWAALALQLTIGRRYGPMTDVAVATTIVGVAAQQALAFLDGDDPAAVEGTLELRLPDWRLRRRSWPMHPECDCAPVREDPDTPALR